MTELNLKNYCELVLKVGVNLQKGQGVYISCPIEKSEYAECLALSAYGLGASIVRVNWENQKIDRLNFEYAEKEKLAYIPKWQVDAKNDLVKNNFCYIAVDGDDPMAFNGVDPERIALYISAKSKAMKGFSESVMQNRIRWCVVPTPTLLWAKKVFPLSLTPLEDLTDAIVHAIRLDGNGVSNWEKHIETLERRAKFLTEKNFEYLRFTSKNGTDIKIGLAVNHRWLSAKEKAMDGIDFVANIPTEEVFTAPHKDKVFGTVKSAMPLCYNGQIIDNFSITFDKGKVVDFSAEKGLDTLKNLIKTDKGTKSIGEVALIGKNSPIAKSKTLFYSTLFDENASCHLALGKAYPTTVKNGDKLSKKELLSLGVNDSVEHVDFMIGTDDLEVLGIGYDKKETPLMKSGEWVMF